MIYLISYIFTTFAAVKTKFMNETEINTTENKSNNKPHLEWLNFVLRNRILFPTKKGLADFLDYKSLMTNDFKKLTHSDILKNYYFIAHEISAITNDAFDAYLLYEYYTDTGKFYKNHVADKSVFNDESCLYQFVNYMFLGRRGANNSRKFLKLINDYDSERANDTSIDPSILILVILGVFKINKELDLTINRVYDRFLDAFSFLERLMIYNGEIGIKMIYENNIIPLFIRYKEDMEAKYRAGEKEYFCNAYILYIFNDVLNTFYNLANSDTTLESQRFIEHCDGDFSGVWMDRKQLKVYSENNEIKLELKNLDNYFRVSLFPNTGCRIFSYFSNDTKNNIIHQTDYMLHFIYENNSKKAFISDPFDYYSFVRDGISTNNAVASWASKESDNKEISELSLKMTFKNNAPALGSLFDNLKLRKLDVENEKILTSSEESYTIVKNEYSVEIITCPLVFTKKSIYLRYGSSIYEIKKFNKSGNETIDGISAYSLFEPLHLCKFMDGKLYLCIEALKRFYDVEVLPNFILKYELPKGNNLLDEIFQNN